MSNTAQFKAKAFESGEGSLRHAEESTRRTKVSPRKRMLPILPKHHFFEHARREQLRAARSNSNVSVLIVAIDAKRNAPPSELVRLATTVQTLVRATDLVGWYAENAIVLLLPDSDPQGLKKCIERIKIEAISYPLQFKVLKPASARLASVSDANKEPMLASSHFDFDHLWLSRGNVRLKRALDIFGALTGIVLLAPIMLLAGVAVKATSKGPVIFKQVRIGKDGKPFVFFKIRSMRADADQGLHRSYVESLIKGASKAEGAGEKTAWSKMEADPRITPVGSFLRKTSIDELPQLFNVLRGDMSLVGPRPPIPYEVAGYSDWHLRRLEVKPGMTGLWQVEARGSMSFDEMVRLDLQYAQNWTVGMDLRILCRTLGVVLDCGGE